jgi:glycosyltransferase involved in cell wall biosynthesis
VRILFITARPPWPGRRGDQMRTGGLARILARRHQVRVLAQRWPSLPSASPPPGVELRTVAIGAPWLGLSAALRRPLQVALHRHRRFQRAVRREREEFRPDVAVVVLSRLGDVLEELDGVPAAVDMIDALSLNMAERARRERGVRQLLFRWEAARMSRWEQRVARQARFSTVVAERDRRALIAGVEELDSKVRVLPLGLPLAHQEPLAVARQPIVALTGNLGYFPTVDGTRWFARRVWPRVRDRHPEAEWWLAGSRPARAVRRLAELPGVRLFADPDDLSSIAHRAAVAIAPLSSGSGTPIKILEAIAASVPVVTTPRGAAGLDDLPAGAVLIADRPEDFADAVVRLLTDPDLARRQTVAARRWLQTRHDLEVVASDFEALLEEAIAGR